MLQAIYKNTAIHYLRLGTGTKILIALHGYGDTAVLYKALVPSLGNRYTIYAIDLPYHGRTRWGADRLYSVQDILGMILAVCEKEKITRFSLMGYSMGGRIAMCVIPHLMSQLEEVYILAASGVKLHPILNAATLPKWLIRLLSFNIRHPLGLFALMKLAKKVGMVSRGVYRFNRHLMATENRRRRIHYTWLSIHDFKVNVPHLQKCLNQLPTPVYLIFGEHDEIVPPWAGQFLAKGLKNALLKIIPTNHFMVNDSLNEVLHNIWEDEPQLIVGDK